MTTTYPHELVNDPNYFRDVLRNMEWVANRYHRRVRFGLTGEGHYPNYQTGWPANHEMSAKVRRFSGRTHAAYHDAPLTTFDDAKLSPVFSWEDVTEMLKARL